MKWTTGLITAPRKKDYYLDKTLISLIKTGWEPIVFAEPGSIIPDWFTGNVIKRRKTYGDWTNWATALYELLLSEPNSDYFLMCEDDGVFCKNTKKYVEKHIKNAPNFATISPYCPGKYHKPNFVGFHDNCNGQYTWSTLSIIMSNEGVRSFFQDYDVQRHRFENIFTDDVVWGVEVEIQNSVKDAVLGQWAKKNNLPMFYHTPSLVAHIGSHSTLSKNITSNDNLAFDFVGEDFNLDDINPKFKNKMALKLF